MDQQWLWLKKPVPKWNPDKWKHGPKPAEPLLFNFEPHPNERCFKSLCGPETLTNSFREGLRGASAAPRVADASGVYIANAYAALTRIEFLLWMVFFVCFRVREHGETTKAVFSNARKTIRTSCRTTHVNRELQQPHADAWK